MVGKFFPKGKMVVSGRGKRFFKEKWWARVGGKTIPMAIVNFFHGNNVDKGGWEKMFQRKEWMGKGFPSEKGWQW